MSKHLYNFKMSQLNVSWFPTRCGMAEFTNHIKEHIHGTQDFVLDKFAYSFLRD